MQLADVHAGLSIVDELEVILSSEDENAQIDSDIFKKYHAEFCRYRFMIDLVVGVHTSTVIPFQ